MPRHEALADNARGVRRRETLLFSVDSDNAMRGEDSPQCEWSERDAGALRERLQECAILHAANLKIMLPTFGGEESRLHDRAKCSDGGTLLRAEAFSPARFWRRPENGPTGNDRRSHRSGPHSAAPSRLRR